VPLSYSVPIESSLHILQTRPFTAVKSILQYLFFGTGIFLTPVMEYTYFVRSDKYPPHSPSETENDSSQPENLPDLEFAYVGSWGTLEKPIPKVSKSLGFNTILVQATGPQSKGTITLVNRDSRTPPLVDPNYLSAREDLETLRKGVEYGLDIGRKMMEKTDKMKPALIPKDSESVEEYIRKYVTGSYHLCSTCRMAERESNGVVDQSLRVYGVQGLRVADASIFPRLVGVKPQATVVMVGEKCAELIQAELKS
jgi:choline dehydrogenase